MTKFLILTGAPEIQLPPQDNVNDTFDVFAGLENTVELSCPFIAQPDWSVVWKMKEEGEKIYQLIRPELNQRFT